MEERSYFSCNYTPKGSYIIVYPFDTLQVLNLFSVGTKIEIANLYIEEGEMLIDKPCQVYTDKNFKSIQQIDDFKQFLVTKNNLFVMQFEFEIKEQKIKVKIDDDVRITFQLTEYSQFNFNKCLKKIISVFPTYYQNDIIKSITENYEKYVCVDEYGKVWKIIDTYNELLDDHEVLATY